MRAFWYEKAGPAAEVMRRGEAERPEPGPGEVLVRVVVSALNPTDVKRRMTGRELALFDRIIPNNDGSGVIEAVGAGVPERRVGERVWLFGAQAGRAVGTAADYVALPSRQAIRLPEGVDFVQGACLGVPAVTAQVGLFADGPIADRTVLVSGGAGRVGACAVQLAKRAGARVIATAGSPDTLAEVERLGADIALDYRREDLVAAVLDATDGAGVDRILDGAFAETVQLAPDLIRANGMIAGYASDSDPTPSIPFLRLMYKNIGIRPFSIYGIPEEVQDRAFGAITEALEAAPLVQRVAREMAFEDMIAAHAAMESESLRGCLLVRVSEG